MPASRERGLYCIQVRSLKNEGDYWGIFELSRKELWSPFKNSRLDLKNLKQIAVNEQNWTGTHSQANLILQDGPINCIYGSEYICNPNYKCFPVWS